MILKWYSLVHVLQLDLMSRVELGKIPRQQDKEQLEQLEAINDVLSEHLYLMEIKNEPFIPSYHPTQSLRF